MLTAIHGFFKTLLSSSGSSATRRRRFGLSGRVAVQSLEDRCMLSAGRLDPTFGDGGVVVSNVAEFQTWFRMADMAVQPDGHIVVVGTADSTTNDVPFESDVEGDRNNRDIVVMRLLPDGAAAGGDPRDHSFGNSGVVRIIVGPGYEAAGALHVLQDGKILIAGTAYQGGLTQTHVWRLNSDGSIDTSFANGAGVATVEDGITFVTDMVVEPSGRIIVTGTADGGVNNRDFVLWAVHADGTTDTGYGFNGLVNTDFINPPGTNAAGRSRYDTPSRAVLLNDGKLLVVGPSVSSSDGTVAARYHSDGSLDTTFGVDGRFIHQNLKMYDVVVLNDGRYLLGGQSAGLMMMLPNGTLDTSFGNSGIATPSGSAGWSWLRNSAIHRLRVLSDGRIQAVAARYDFYGQYWAPPSQDDDFSPRVFVQFHADGTMDASFGIDGLMQPASTISSNAWHGFVYGDIWQEDGRILLMSGAEQATLVRLLPDFSPDPTFNEPVTSFWYRGATVPVTLPSSDEAHGVTLLPDGKILVTGRSRGVFPTWAQTSASYPEAGGALVQRYDASGHLDSSFDGVADAWWSPSNGSLVFAPFIDSYRIGEGAVISDIVLLNHGGFFAPMLQNDRSIMNGFEFNRFGQMGDGWSSYIYSGANASQIGGVVRLADGRIVLAGVGRPWGTGSGGTNVGTIVILAGGDGTDLYDEQARWYTGDFFPLAMRLTDSEDLVIASKGEVARYDLDGNRLVTFATAFEHHDFEIRDLALTSDGRTAVSGVTDIDGARHGFVARFLSDGTLDPSFGLAGRVVLPAMEDAEANAVAVTHDGRIVVWGQIGNSLAAFQLNVDGSADTSFGHHGVTRIVAVDDARRHVGTALAIQPDGAIVGVGYVTQFDGREDVVMVRLQGDNPILTPSITHITPDNGRHDRDGITNAAELSVHGTAMPNQIVLVSINGVEAGSTTTDADGHWTYDYSHVTLPEGRHTVAAVSESGDAVSHRSAEFVIVVDQTPPAPSVPQLVSDWMSPDDDQVIDYRSYEQGIRGTAESESTVYLYLNDQPVISYYDWQQIQTVAFDRSVHLEPATWRIRDYAFEVEWQYGRNSFSTEVQDLAGNLSGRSEPLTFWLVGSNASGAPEVTVTGFGTWPENVVPPLVFTSTDPEFTGQARLRWSGTATSGTDYQPLNLDFASGSINTLNYHVDDTLYEPDETITVRSFHNNIAIAEQIFITIQEDDAPSLAEIPDLAAVMGESMELLPIMLGNFATGVDVPLTVSSDNSSLFPAGSLVVSGTDAFRQLQLIPAAGISGGATISVTAGHGMAQITRTFSVRIADAASINTVVPIPDLVGQEDTPFAPVTISITGSNAEDVVLSATSDNPDLFPAGSISFTGTGAQRSLQIVPADNQHGPARLTVEARDSAGRIHRQTVLLTVTSVNDAPVVEALAHPWSTAEDVSISLTANGLPWLQVSDVDSGSVAVQLTLEPSSGAWSGSHVSGVSVSRSGAAFVISGAIDRVNTYLANMSFVPAANWHGTALIGVAVTDVAANNELPVTVSLPDIPIVVHSVADAPVLPTISRLTFMAGQPVDFTFFVSDVDTSYPDLSFSFVSGDEFLLPLSGISMDHSSATVHPTLTLNAISEVLATTTLTVTVTDDTNLTTTREYDVVVLPPSLGQPIVTGPSVVNATEDTPAEFQISFFEDGYPSDAFSVSIGASGVVGTSGLVVSGSGGTRTVSVTPGADVYGNAWINTIVRNIYTQRLTIFSTRVIFAPQNDAPVIAPIQSQWTAAQQPVHVFPVDSAFSVSDIDSDILAITVETSEGLLSFPHAAHIAVLEGDAAGATRLTVRGSQTSVQLFLNSLVFTPDADFTGAAQISLTVHDSLSSGQSGQWATTAYVLLGNTQHYQWQVTGAANQGYASLHVASAPVELMIEFATATPAEAISVYEFLVGASSAQPHYSKVRRIELQDEHGAYHTVWNGILPHRGAREHSELLVRFPRTTYAVQKARLTLHDPGVFANAYVDAVFLHDTFDVDFAADQTVHAVVPILVSSPPSIAPIADILMMEDIASPPIDILVSDGETSTSDLLLTAVAADPEMIQDLHFIETNGAWQLMIVPAEDRSGITQITVTVADETHQQSISFEAEITAVNDAPRAIQLSSGSVSEDINNTTASVEIGRLTAVDPDSTSHGFQLVAGSGDTDNDYFVVNGDILSLKAGVVVDFEVQPAYSIRIEADDGLATAQFSLTLTVENVTEQLGLAVPAMQIVEGEPATSLVVTRNTSINVPQTVTLWTSHSSELQIPETVTIPAGQRQVTVEISVVDNYQATPEYVAMISATATDAEPAWLPVTIVDDDPQAVWIRTYEELDGSNGFRLEGVVAGEGAGWTVDSAGDLNADGFDDVIIGVYRANPRGFDSGRTYVVLGRATGFDSAISLASLDGTNGFEIEGLAEGDSAGWSVGPGNDVNGDGIDDLIIGAHGADNGGSQAGSTYVVLGTSTGFSAVLDLAELDGTNGYRIDGIGFLDRSGFSVSSAGDVNADGYGDLIIGAPRFLSDSVVLDTGAAYVVFGTAGAGNASSFQLSNLDGTNGFRIDAADPMDWGGVTVSSAGDFNGDGYGDIVIGSSFPHWGFADDGPGTAYLIFGRSDGFAATVNLGTLDGTSGFQMTNNRIGEQFGRNVDSVGDLNGDGYDDIVISAHTADATTGGAQAGVVYVIFGHSGISASTVDVTLLNGTNGFRLDAIDPGDNIGFSVGRAGDVNGDGFDDLIVGAPFAEDPSAGSSSEEGETYVILGQGLPFAPTVGLRTLIGRNAFVLNGIDAIDNSGVSVSGAGDVNGDGFDDIIVGARGADITGTETNDGEAYVVFGGDFRGDPPFQIGDSADNTIRATGGPNRDVLVGGQGDDLLVSDGGSDVLRGGAGNDVLAVIDTDFASTRRLVGGSGFDTLRLDGRELTLDLTSIADNRIQSIEQIDIRGTGSNTLILNVREVLNLSRHSNTLVVLRDADDMVVRGNGWTQQLDDSSGPITWEVFTQGAAVLRLQKTTYVTLAAGAAVAEDSGAGINITFTRDHVTGSLTVDFFVTGSAEFGVDYAVDGFAELTNGGGSVTFADGVSEVVVTITPQADALVEANEEITLSLPGGGPHSTATVSIVNDDTAVFEVNDVTVSESDGTATFTVSQSNPIDVDVIMDVTFVDVSATSADYEAFTQTLKFTAHTSNVQTLTVPITDDRTVELLETFRVLLALHAVDSSRVRNVDVTDSGTGTIVDNDTATFTINDVTVSEADGTALFTLSVDHPLDIPITIDVSFQNVTTDVGDFDGSRQTIVFATEDSEDKPIIVPISNDSLAELMESFTASLSINAATPMGSRTVVVSDYGTGTIIDDDVRGITVSAISGNTSESGDTATFTVVLTSQATADVTIPLSSSDPNEGTVSPASLIFTVANWNVAQTVTITGVNDDIDDGNIDFTILTASATGGDYEGLNPIDVAVTNVDDDVRGITVSAVSGNTSESGDTASFTVVLTSQPKADVTIPLSSSDPNEGTVSPNTLVFTAANWNVAQTVIITGVNDDIDDGNIDFTILTASAAGGDYDGLNAVDVAVTNVDDDVRGITVSAISGNTTEAGGTATFTVVLTSQPTADVTIPLSSSDPSEGTVSPASLIFTAANWNVAQTVTVTGVNDDVDDGNIDFTILTASATDGDYHGLNPIDVVVTNVNDDVLGITVSAISGNTTEAGGTATFTAVLTSQPTADVTIPLSSSDPTEGTVSPASLVFTAANWNVVQTVTITGVNDDIDDGNIDFTILTSPAAGGDYDGLNAADVAVTNVDDDVRGITVSAISGNTSESGDTATFTVVLNSQPTEDVTIPLSSSDSTEGIVSPTSLIFSASNWNVAQTVTVTGVNDYEADGDVAYAIIFGFATGGGYHGATSDYVSVANVDDGISSTNAPQLNLNGTDGADLSVVYDMAAGGAQLVATGGLTIADSDPGDLIRGATVTIADGFQAEDVIDVTTVHGILVTRQDHVLTLDGSASVATYEQILGTLTFDTTSNSPDDRILVVQVTDLGGNVSIPRRLIVSLADHPVFATIDIDHSGGTAAAQSDGLLVFAVLAGVRSTSQLSGLVSSRASSTVSEIVSKVHELREHLVLDVDGNGSVLAQSDGLLIFAILAGVTSPRQLSSLLGSGATRSVQEILNYVQSLAAPPAATAFSAPVTAPVLPALNTLDTNNRPHAFENGNNSDISPSAVDAMWTGPAELRLQQFDTHDLPQLDVLVPTRHLSSRDLTKRRHEFAVSRSGDFPVPSTSPASRANLNLLDSFFVTIERDHELLAF